MISLILVVLFLLLLSMSAFFSSAETAYFSIDPIQTRRIGGKYPSFAHTLRVMLASPAQLLSTILIGNTIVNVALANVGYSLASHWLTGGVAEAVTVPSVTILLVLFGEVLPKQLGLLYTSGIVYIYSRPIRFFKWMLTPLRNLLDQTSKRFAQWLRPRGKTLSEEEFETVLDISKEEGILNADELAMIKAIVDLEDMHASDVMTPRVDFKGIDLSDPDFPALELARSAKLNFLVLYNDQVDQISGFLDVRKYLLDPDHSISSATIPPTFIPEGVPLNSLLGRFQKEKIRIAAVIDEYGGIAGIVTRGDILEEITGDIYNELSKPRPIFQQAGPHSWLVDANISLEEINKKLLLDLDAETSDRLAGWISEKLGRLPATSDVVDLPDLRVTVMKTSKLRVTLALIEKLGTDKPAATDNLQDGEAS